MRNSATAMARYVLILAAALSLFGAGCDRRDDLDGRRRPIPGLEQTAPVAGGIAATGQRRELAFDGFNNRVAAEVIANGALVVDGRSPALAAYTRGGAGGGWILGSGSNPAARVDGQVAHFWFWRDAEPGGIAATADGIPLRLKFRPAAAEQLVSVFLNGEKVADVPMEARGTSVYEASLPASKVRAGPNHLRLFFRYAVPEADVRTAGSLDRIAVGAGSMPSRPPLLAAPVDHGGERRDALSMSGAGRVSMFVQIPPTRPTLELAVAGKGRVEVRVARASGESARLWSERAADAWRVVEIDLSEIAGELVRIDLVGDAAVDWARPRILADPADTAASSPAAADHVILVVASALRAAALDQMPALRALGDGGVTRTAISRHPAPGDSAHEIWAGRPGEGVIAASTETLAEKLKRAGYATALFSSGPAVAGDGQGFDKVARLDGAAAVKVWAAARERLAMIAQRRSFTAVWLGDPALPWNPDPKRVDRSFSGYSGRVQPSGTRWLSQSIRGAGAAPLGSRDRDVLRALYAGELAEVNAAIAAMRADLASMGIAERTAIVAVGDRGQELFERGGFGDPVGLWREGIEVPLIARPAGGVGPDRADPTLLLVADAHATVLELAQIPGGGESVGRSALAQTPVRFATLYLPGRARGAQWGRYKWVIPKGEEPVLFDRVADGAESADRVKSAPVAARALSGWLGLRASFGDRWSHRRWGSVTSLRPAFAAEVGGL
jgi:hypothetical protein